MQKEESAMQQHTNQTGPEAWQIDPEIFRRVWARVMPNEAGSLVAVDPPGGQGGKTQPSNGTGGTLLCSVHSPAELGLSPDGAWHRRSCTASFTVCGDPGSQSPTDGP